MKIVDALAQNTPAYSFEFFPPRSEEGLERLYTTISRLESYSPTYVSVTYGAGGSTRRLTVELVERIKRETGIETMAHLTCVGASGDELAGVLDQLAAVGVENVLPLRGDPPRGESTFVPHPDGFSYASELAAFVRSRWSFCLAGACYPEKHVEAADLETDLDNLKRKVDAGVEFLITQLFFDDDDYFRFVDRARARGIDLPIVAGIMPITNLSQIKRFTAMCGATIPKTLLARLEPTDPDRVGEIGIEHAIQQCRRLVEGGAPGIHFYTLNKSRATVDILEALRSS